MKKVFGLLFICLFYTSLVRTQAQNSTSLLPDSLAKAPDSVKLWTLRELGDSLSRLRQYVTSKQAYTEALLMAERVNNKKGIGLGYRGLAYWNNQTGDYAKAIEWAQKALQVFEQLGDKRQFARTLLYISASYDRLHDYKQAKRYAEQCLAISQKENYTDQVIFAYQDLAIYESKVNRNPQALALRLKVLDYYREKNDSVSYAYALYDTGLLYKNMGQYVLSEKAFKDVLAFARIHKDDFLAGYVAISMPYALIPQDKLNEAEAYCRQALAWVQKSGGEKHLFMDEINGHLSRLWERRGNYQQALHYYRLQMAEHDSIVNSDRNRQVAELEARYESRVKETEIQNLEASNERKNRQIWVAGVGIVALVGLLCALYTLYQRLLRSNRRIQQQSDQMALMMKETHHRVKNNLSMVSGLLYLQTTRLNDKAMIQEMKDSQQRVEAMSLIHQRLYQSDRTTLVNMDEYLSDLAEGILKAYGYQLSDFDLRLKVDLDELDVDTAIPLGLIVTELLTNSFKYAYTNCQSPMLRIALHKSSYADQSGITLEVQDNGVGIDMTDWQKQEGPISFGKKLITLLAEQLEGQFELIKQNGTLFRLFVPQMRMQVS